MTERLATLDAIEARVWLQLAGCVGDKAHAWRTPVLATVNGDCAEARTVILREVDMARKRLLAYTDERASKVGQFLRTPHGTFVMWSPQLGWQLRCRVRLSVEMSGLSTSSRWARIRLSPAAQEYLSPLPPGTPLPALPPTHTALEREYFSVINAEVTSIDWLELRAEGQRRAQLCVEGNQWLQP